MELRRNSEFKMQKVGCDRVLKDGIVELESK